MATDLSLGKQWQTKSSILLCEDSWLWVDDINTNIFPTLISNEYTSMHGTKKWVYKKVSKRSNRNGIVKKFSWKISENELW